MRFVLLVVVVVGWLLYIASWLRARSETRRSNSIHSFSRNLSVLGRTGPVRTIAPSAAVIPLRPSYLERPVATRISLSQARRRRRDVLAGLVFATIASVGMALLFGSFGAFLLVVSASALAAYAGLLVRAQRIGTERRTKVRYLPYDRGNVEPAQVLLLHRSAN